MRTITSIQPDVAAVVAAMLPSGVSLDDHGRVPSLVPKEADRLRKALGQHFDLGVWVPVQITAIHSIDAASNSFAVTFHCPQGGVAHQGVISKRVGGVLDGLGEWAMPMASATGPVAWTAESAGGPLQVFAKVRPHLHHQLNLVWLFMAFELDCGRAIDPADSIFQLRPPAIKARVDRPTNYGKKWDGDDDATLCSLIHDKTPITRIAVTMGRSPGGIVERMVDIGLCTVEDGKALRAALKQATG